MKNKPVIFLSHIHEEKELALSLKSLIEESFIGMVDVFVSSDESSNGTGQRWLTNIEESLESCRIGIILCSPLSINKPWVNFEAGACWKKNIPVVPICHSGISPNTLPIPLSLLNAIDIKLVSGLKGLFTCIAKSIGGNVPEKDFTQFINFATQFEEKYLFWDNFNNYLEQLNNIDAISMSYNNSEYIPSISKKILQEQSSIMGIGIRENDIRQIQQLEKSILNYNLIKFESYTGGSSTIGMSVGNKIISGNFFSCNFKIDPSITKFLNDKRITVRV